jgi:Mg2+/Co2+ transporter CorC
MAEPKKVFFNEVFKKMLGREPKDASESKELMALLKKRASASSISQVVVWCGKDQRYISGWNFDGYPTSYSVLESDLDKVLGVLSGEDWLLGATNSSGE